VRYLWTPRTAASTAPATAPINPRHAAIIGTHHLAAASSSNALLWRAIAVFTSVPTWSPEGAWLSAATAVVLGAPPSPQGYILFLFSSHIACSRTATAAQPLLRRRARGSQGVLSKAQSGFNEVASRRPVICDRPARPDRNLGMVTQRIERFWTSKAFGPSRNLPRLSLGVLSSGYYVFDVVEREPHGSLLTPCWKKRDSNRRYRCEGEAVLTRAILATFRANLQGRPVFLR
jgi:hypothetical protein